MEFLESGKKKDENIFSRLNLERRKGY